MLSKTVELCRRLTASMGATRGGSPLLSATARYNEKSAQWYRGDRPLQRRRRRPPFRPTLARVSGVTQFHALFCSKIQKQHNREKKETKGDSANYLEVASRNIGYLVNIKRAFSISTAICTAV